ncbi:MAG: apolipoprotein N-acyltransferase [Mucinivorans sp.]
MKFIKKPLFLSLLSALLLSLPWLNMGSWWILFAFVPLFWLQKSLQSAGRRGFLWWVALALCVWITLTCFWVSFAFAAASIIVPLVGIASLWPAWWLYNIVSKRSGRALSYTIFICAWIVAEWWYSVGDVSFPWLTLGGAWAWSPWAVQWYSLTGVYGGTLWILIANIAIFTALTKPRVWYFVGAWVVVPIVVSLSMYWSYTEPVERIKVAVIQPNIDPYTEKYETDGLAVVLSLAATAPAQSELFVAPETAIVNTIDLNDSVPNQDVLRVQRFLSTRPVAAAFIVGAMSHSGDTYYNTALYIDSNGVQTYHKGKLVIGVETTPSWAAWAARAIDMGGYVGSLGRQAERDIFRASVPVGSAICYESIYGEYFSQWVASGARLMTIITNDGWWGDTPGYRHHAAYASLRAIECGRAIARSANTGVSALIDSRGVVGSSLGWDERGVVSGSLPLGDGITPYVRWGDMTARLALYVGALALLFFIGRSRDTVIFC